MNNLYLKKEFISNIFIISMIIMLFTQLRLFNLPIGIGEIGLLLLGVISLFQFMKEKKSIFYCFKHLFIIFWLFIFIILLLYLWINITDIHQSNKNLVHDILAYGFIFYNIILFITLENLYDLNFKILMERLVYYSIIFYSVLLAFSFSFGDFLGITLNYMNVERYVGLSLNANQLALVFTIIPFLVLFYDKNSQTNLYENKTINLLLFLLSVFIIYSIASRGLVLSLLIITMLTVVIYLFRQYPKSVSLLFFLLISIIIINYQLLIELLFIQGIGGFKHRIELWENALELIKLSPLIGFGPGAHVSSVVNPNIYWEAHNTFLDLTLQVGIIGLIAYIFLLYSISKGLIINKKYLLFSAFSVLVLFSSVHFILRHPLFWLYLFYFYQFRKSY